MCTYEEYKRRFMLKELSVEITPIIIEESARKTSKRKRSSNVESTNYHNKKTSSDTKRRTAEKDATKEKSSKIKERIEKVFKFYKNPSSTPYECMTCELYFENSFEVLNHHNHHHKTQKSAYYCYQCEKEYKSHFLLAAHVPEHAKISREVVKENKNKYLCPTCFNYFEDCFQLKRHLITFHKYDKNECNRMLENINSAENVLVDLDESSQNSNPSKTAEAEFTCEICFDMFSTKSSLNEHLAIHVEIMNKSKAESNKSDQKKEKSTSKETVNASSLPIITQKKRKTDVTNLRASHTVERIDKLINRNERIMNSDLNKTKTISKINISKGINSLSNPLPSTSEIKNPCSSDITKTTIENSDISNPDSKEPDTNFAIQCRASARSLTAKIQDMLSGQIPKETITIPLPVKPGLVKPVVSPSNVSTNKPHMNAVKEPSSSSKHKLNNQKPNILNYQISRYLPKNPIITLVPSESSNVNQFSTQSMNNFPSTSGDPKTQLSSTLTTSNETHTLLSSDTSNNDQHIIDISGGTEKPNQTRYFKFILPNSMPVSQGIQSSGSQHGSIIGTQGFPCLIRLEDLIQRSINNIGVSNAASTSLPMLPVITSFGSVENTDSSNTIVNNQAINQTMDSSNLSLPTLPIIQNVSTVNSDSSLPLPTLPIIQSVSSLENDSVLKNILSAPNISSSTSTPATDEEIMLNVLSAPSTSSLNDFEKLRKNSILDPKDSITIDSSDTESEHELVIDESATKITLRNLNDLKLPVIAEDSPDKPFVKNAVDFISSVIKDSLTDLRKKENIFEKETKEKNKLEKVETEENKLATYNVEKVEDEIGETELEEVKKEENKLANDSKEKKKDKTEETELEKNKIDENCGTSDNKESQTMIVRKLNDLINKNNSMAKEKLPNSKSKLKDKKTKKILFRRKCEECQLFFYKRRKWKEHRSIEARQNCTICVDSFCSSKTLYFHYKMSHGLICCYKCDYRTKNAEDLPAHNRLKHFCKTCQKEDVRSTCICDKNTALTNTSSKEDSDSDSDSN